MPTTMISTLPCGIFGQVGLDPHLAAWLVLSGASAGGFALSFVFSQWFLHAGDFWRTPVLADLPGAIQCL